VTYFFNGGQENKSPGEDHILIPSKSVSSYDQIPEMSAPEITTKVIEVVADNLYDFILINFANADMVGHTGNIEAAIRAVECLDSSVDKIVKSVLAKNGVVMITADHGNAEVMFNMQTGQIDKEHTANPVPFILVGKEYAGRSIGWLDPVSDDLSTAQTQGILSDVAPTILQLLGIEKPKEMTGMSLLE
jgi:2,3-bisphosphoglycerate-independent phosphoglycerate mutase